jgi:hypothetical protein
MKNLDMIDSRWLEQVSGGRGTTRSTSVNSRLGTLGYGTAGLGGLPLGLSGGLPLLGGGLFGGLGNNFAIQQAIADKKQQEQTMLCVGLMCALRR